MTATYLYKWYSSIDGDLSDSASFSVTSTLSNGTHIISFNVQDNDGSWSELISSDLTVKATEQGSPENETDSTAPALVNVSPAVDSSFDEDTSNVDIRLITVVINRRRAM
ncbi:MAG: hypothetical protein R2741_10520 [Methanolobus sp.]